MDSSRDSEFDARLVQIEAAIVVLQRSVASLIAERSPALSRDAPAEPQREPRQASYSGEATAPAPASSLPKPPNPPAAARATRAIGDVFSPWFASRDAEWWLSRVGIGFVILAVLLLFRYAIDHGWITPPIRVLAGVIVGGMLFWAATRVHAERETAVESDLGLRELLMGGGLAVWYVTTYAAAVWYHLVPMPAARLVFFLLGVLSTWIALRERREIFALVAVIAGFAAPYILPAPDQSMIESSLYLGSIGAIGLIIYLMRGWHAILWITFVAFWATAAGPAFLLSHIPHPASAPIALSILLVAAGIAFTRVPLLRRELLAIGSPRYTPTPITNGIKRLMEVMDAWSRALGGGKSAPDSLVVWILMLASAVLAIALLTGTWPLVPEEIWGVYLVLLGLGALALFRRAVNTETETAHVEITAAVLWTVIGVGRIAPTPEWLPAIALVAALVIASVARQFVGPRVIAKVAIGLALFVIASHELAFADTGFVHLRWVLAEIVILGGAAFIVRRLIAEPAEMIQGIVLGAVGYLTALIILWRVLLPVWAPLVTASYAILGAALLILSRRYETHSLLRYLGGATMLIVVGRLLLVDLSSVETIWRVLLFLVCGAVFLYTANRMRAKPMATGEK